MQIHSLTDPQQQVIRILHSGLIVPRRLTNSIHALQDAGYLDEHGMLTDAGRALIDEEMLIEQHANIFKQGDPVEHSHWESVKGVWVHQWRPAKVEAIGVSAVKLRFPDGHVERRRAYHVRHVIEERKVG